MTTEFYSADTGFHAYTRGELGDDWPARMSPARFYKLLLERVSERELVRIQRQGGSILDTVMLFDRSTGNLTHGATPKTMRLSEERRWFALGCPSYKIHPDMVEALANTSIEIPNTELHLPFPVICLRLPKETFREHEDAPWLEAVIVSTELLLDPSNATRALPADVRFDATLARKEYNIRLNMVSFFSSETGGWENSITSTIRFRHGNTIAEDIEATPINKAPDEHYWMGHGMVLKIAALAISTSFIAIGANRKLVRRARQSSSERRGEKKLRKRFGDEAAGRLGWSIGADIVLPKNYDRIYSPKSERAENQEPRELDFGHIRSGHMRWQLHKDELGRWHHKLIFIGPVPIRPDKPLKPRITPRVIRPRRLRPRPPLPHEHKQV